MVSVVVVGASAAGLETARALAEGGAETSLVEASGSLGHSPADTVIDSMVKRCGIDIPEKAIRSRVRGVRLMTSTGVCLEFPSTGVKLDRVAFDDHFVSAIKAAGGTVKLGTRVEGLSLSRGKVTGVKMVEGGTKQEMECDVLVVASGFKNPWLGELPMTPVRYPHDVARGFQVDMEEVDIDQDFFEFIVGRTVAPGWKAALSPSSEGKGTIGIYIRGKAPGAEDRYLDDLISSSPVSSKIAGGKVLRKTRGFDPIATIPEQLVHRNLVMVGCACGQSGIPYGMASGRMAASAIIASQGEETGLLEYQTRWKKEYLGDYIRGRTALQVLDRFADSDLDLFFHALSAADVEERDVNRLGDILYLGGSLLVHEPKLFFRIIRISLGLALA